MGVGLEVEVFIFDGPPEAFDEDIIQGSAASIHADADAFPLQFPSEAGGGELAALIGVEDVGLAEGERIVEGLQTEVSLHRIGDPPG